MDHPDLFVGAAAIGVGLAAIGSAAFNWNASYQLRKVQWVEQRVGRAGARVFYGVLGIGLIVLGSAISLGFAPNKGDSRSDGKTRTPPINTPSQLAEGAA